ncbi:Scr1 family TA system antitoxin-like transcriptional regulator [Streptomyces sp. NPDC006530]|uniref:Scr1 family TA system antitoxin-like transcriptional regulator n=1 Tax=Streptomyces sp. NPDC006530 TaxID=3364750 RepID=UPI003693D71E
MGAVKGRGELREKWARSAADRGFFGGAGNCARSGHGPQPRAGSGARGTAQEATAVRNRARGTRPCPGTAGRGGRGAGRGRAVEGGEGGCPQGADQGADAASDWYRDYAQLEAQAVELSAYNNQSIPGLLQTESYARAVFTQWRPLLSDAIIEQRVADRLARQQVWTRVCCCARSAEGTSATNSCADSCISVNSGRSSCS